MTEENTIPPLTGDRGGINVRGRSKSTKIIILIVVGVIFVVMALVLGSLLTSKKAETFEKVKEDETLNVGSTYNNKGNINNTMAEILREEEAKAKADADLKRRLAEEEERKRLEAEAERKRQLEEAEKLAKANEGMGTNNIYSYNDSSSQSNNAITPAERKRAGDTLIPILNNSSQEISDYDSSINDMLKGEVFANGTITQLDDMKFLLSRGTLLPCVLKTKIVTDYSGLPICILTKDIYSSNGDVLLLRAGTSFFGEQTKVIAQGQTRVFINWTTAQDGNIRIRIDSLGTDTLGASGAPAWVDNHFWKRFGGAIMLSFVDDALKTASNNLSKSDNRISYESSSDTANDMAKVALENTINIPPTAYINQGELLFILVPRDVDFRGTYRTVKK